MSAAASSRSQRNCQPLEHSHCFYVNDHVRLHGIPDCPGDWTYIYELYDDFAVVPTDHGYEDVIYDQLELHWIGNWVPAHTREHRGPWILRRSRDPPQ